ncbi:MAG: hypothetical protein MZV65_43530 [Chromatiales bacterium]|nr:hypothetical protein [Chromatiales bacterium]
MTDLRYADDLIAKIHAEIGRALPPDHGRPGRGRAPCPAQQPDRGHGGPLPAAPHPRLAPAHPARGQDRERGRQGGGGMNTSTQLLHLIGAEGEAGLTLDALDYAIEHLRRASIVSAVMILVERGLVERPAPGRYRLTAAGRIALHSQGGLASYPASRAPRRCAYSLRTRLWHGMRVLQKFSVDDLLLRAARGDEADARNNALKYVNALERAGYLVRMRQRLPGDAPTSNGFVRWLLVRNTGPQAPIWQNAKGQIHDPNSGDTLDLGAAPEVAHALTPTPTPWPCCAPRWSAPARPPPPNGWGSRAPPSACWSRANTPPTPAPCTHASSMCSAACAARTWRPICRARSAGAGTPAGSRRPRPPRPCATGAPARPASTTPPPWRHSHDDQPANPAQPAELPADRLRRGPLRSLRNAPVRRP